MKKVSVIIPVYNGKDVIGRAIGTLLQQSLDDIEIIIVDDASTDPTPQILVELDQQYPDRLKVILKEKNSGPGDSRNIGLSYAEGEYIGFLDSDDYVSSSMYEELYLRAKEGGFDVVDCGFYQKSTDRAIVFTSDDLCGELTPEKRSRLIASGGYIVTKLFKREFLQREKILFRNAYVLEDMDFLTHVFLTAGSIANVKEVLYFYDDTEASLSKTQEPGRYIDAALSAMKAVYLVGEKNENKKIREAIDYAILQLYSYSIVMSVKAWQQGLVTKEKALSLLQNLRKEKKDMVRGGYDNPYVSEKIEKQDISLMKLNDNSPKALLT